MMLPLLASSTTCRNSNVIRSLGKSASRRNNKRIFQYSNCFLSSISSKTIIPNEHAKRYHSAGSSHSDMMLFDSLSGKNKPLYQNLSKCRDNLEAENMGDDDNAESVSKGIAWYTCGPTVYDSAHLGHARTYVTIDIMHRILLHLHSIRSSSNNGYGNSPAPPLFIMNITDVDDKILQRAKERNVCPKDLANKFEKEFWEDMVSLNVMKPTVVTRVTEHVEDSIIPYIDRIIKNGLAYIIPEENSESKTGSPKGSVYFDINAFESISGRLNKYGKLAAATQTPEIQQSVIEKNDHPSSSTFFSWEIEKKHHNDNEKPKGLRSQSKRDPRDFALWKFRQGVEEEMFWDSPWGPGRPGWHIECSAMIERTMKLFKSHELVVHAGGIDLKFPHHTNEIAQAEAYHLKKKCMQRNEEWIPHWIHTGHLHIRGMKMSKSLKNFITIRQLLSDLDSIDEEDNISSSNFIGDDFRMWCLGLSGSYRGPATFSISRIEEARVVREKITQFLSDSEEWMRNTSISNLSSTSRWEEDDVKLYKEINDLEFKCHQFLFGSQDSGEFNGTKYLEGILTIVHEGKLYLGKKEHENIPTEPIQHVLNTLRKLLSIVGFSDITVEAGIQKQVANNIYGTKEDVIDEFVSFRSDMRMLALANLKSKPSPDKGNLSQNILKACDDIRDNILPAIGVEVFDEKKTKNFSNQTGDNWRYSVRKPMPNTKIRDVTESFNK